MYGKIVVSMLLALASTLQAMPGRPTRFKVLAEGSKQGEADARELVIRDASSLQTVWDDLQAKSDQLPIRGTEVPKVDFKTHVVVFIRMETQSDFDSSIEVTHVVRERARVGRNAQTVITVEESQREAGCSMISVVQHVTPYTLVEVEGTQEVVFRHVQKAIPCTSYIPQAPPGKSPKPRRKHAFS